MLDKKDRALGAFMGLAIGDALGVPAEFKMRGEFAPIKGMRGGGPFRLKAGEWTDDTSMALCLADSLNAFREFRGADVLESFHGWWTTGYNSHNGRCFDIGTTTRNAIMKFINTGKIDQADAHIGASGNGGIMRLVPAVIFHHKDRDAAIACAVAQSDLTHPSVECKEGAEKLAGMIFDAIHGASKEDLVDVERLKILPAESIPSSGYVAHTMLAAQWAIATTDNFRDALLAAVNLGDDADTTGAVTGQIAGALYGLSSIPQEWLDVLVWREKLMTLAEELWTNGEL